MAEILGTYFVMPATKVNITTNNSKDWSMFHGIYDDIADAVSNVLIQITHIII